MLDTDKLIKDLYRLLIAENDDYESHNLLGFKIGDGSEADLSEFYKLVSDKTFSDRDYREFFYELYVYLIQCGWLSNDKFDKLLVT